jgi:DNA-binding NtrC family response regulator
MRDVVTVSDSRSARLVKAATGARELVGRSAAIARVHELVRRAALAGGGALLVAERGIDVESVARELHERTPGPAGRFERVECAAADPGRLDRLLFGASPAFASDLETAASDSRFAAACGGTLFLQDITEMPASVQARIARIARDGEVRIDGKPTATNIRLMGSAAPGIEADVHTNRFRGDLFRRLAASRIDLPSLRDRAEDVPALATRLLEDWCAAQARAARSFTQPALALLSALTWAGNIAELHVVVERAATNTPHDVIQIEDVLPALNLDRIDRAPARVAPVGNLRDARLRFERDYISSMLQHHGWRIAEAAHALGIQRPNLYRKARQLGIPVARTSD